MKKNEYKERVFDLLNTHIIAAISIIISFILAFSTYKQWKDKLKIARANYMNSLIEKLHNDEPIAKTL